MKRVFLKTKYFLILVLLIAIFLRFWNLGGVPPSASMDEASIGYNAYSILKTGLDEFGQVPLISQRGYDDYRRSTYLFLVSPSVGIFGLNAFSIRLPAAVLSVLTVFATYYIMLLLFTKRLPQANILALLASFLLAISPWHIYISRLGHESNACLSFFIFGVLSFLLGEKRKNWMLIFLSMIFFTLSMVSYYSGQAFIPLFVAALVFIFRKSLISMISKNRKILLPFIILGIFLIPIFLNIFSPNSLIRFQGTSVFLSDPQRSINNAIKRANALENKDYLGVLVYNRRVLMVRQFSEAYLSHFNPKWLFFNSGKEPHKVPNLGVLYLLELPFILLGIFVFLRNQDVDERLKKLLIIWFFLSPIPAALATQAPHAMRSYNFLPTWQIFSAFGIWYSLFRPTKQKIILISFFVVFSLLNLSLFYKNYFGVFPKEQSDSFHYAMSKAVPYVLKHQEDYYKIVFSNQDNLYQSYMVFLFHSKYDPLLYRKQGGTISGGFAENHRFGKYEFRPIQSVKKEKGVLYVGNASDFSPKDKILTRFSNLNGEVRILVAEGK